jgi:hypothetical protein
MSRDTSFPAVERAIVPSRAVGDDVALRGAIHDQQRGAILLRARDRADHPAPAADAPREHAREYGEYDDQTRNERRREERGQVVRGR